jgi:hypothetical protein
MSVTDILLDSDFDVTLKDGDFAVGDATYQHQAILLQAGAGEIKQYPTAGVGVEGYLLDENPATLLREIRSQFTKDGMQVSKVSISPDGQLDINAQYP